MKRIVKKVESKQVLEAQLLEQQKLHEEAEGNLTELESRRILDFIAAGGSVEKHAQELAAQRELVAMRARAVDEARELLQAAEQQAVSEDATKAANEARKHFANADSAAHEVEVCAAGLIRALDRMLAARRLGQSAVVLAAGEEVAHPHFRLLGYEDAWRLADFRKEADELAQGVSMNRGASFASRAAALHRRALSVVRPVAEAQVE